MEEVGIECDPDDEAVDLTWFNSRDNGRLAGRVAELCGDPEVGQKVGVELFNARSDLKAFIHSAGSISEALRVVVNMGSRTRTEPAFVIGEEGPTHLVVYGTAKKSSRFACGTSTGHWSMVPTLFGSVGAVVEPLCVTRGDDRCEFRISWTPPSDETDGVERSRSRSGALVSRFEELQSLAAELADESTIDGLLHTIAEKALSAVLAPAAVVAVRLADGDSLRIGWSGLDQSAALELAHSLDMGGVEPTESTAVAPIASARRSYGHLAINTQPGIRVSGNEWRMLNAYAGHATAAIEAAAALEAARFERDTAEALLGLARTLASVGGTNEIAQRIAEAVPSIVRCDLSAVMLLDDLSQTLSFAGSWPHPVDSLGFDAIRIEDLPLARQIIDGQIPMFSVTSDTDGLLRALLRTAGAKCVSTAPIVIRDAVAGLVLAASTDEFATIDVDTVLHRLGGLADHAATALDNSRLLDHVSYQALHDPLTGLANRSLIEDRVQHALAVAERVDRWVTMLFVDLDRFKKVNDDLGHAAGDEILKQLAGRLAECVRVSDTVSRLGGDEFLILLENTCGDEDGARVADKIAEAVRAPFVIDDQVVNLSVSIGITSAPGRGTSYNEMLGRADQAMYEVKHRGRDGWSVFTMPAT